MDELFNLEAEQTILGALLINPDQDFHNATYEKLKEEAFYGPANQQIYKVIKEMFDKKQTIDIITVPDEIKKQNINVTLDYVLQLATECSFPSRIEPYIEMVNEYSTRRKLKLLGMKIVSGIDPYTPIDEQVSTIQDDLNNITQGTGKEEYHGLGDDVMETLGKVAVPRMFFTRFQKFDDIVSFEPQKLVVVSGDAGLGKTSLCLQFALQAVNYGKKVFYVSLEMSQRTTVMRLASIHSGKPMVDIVRDPQYLGALTQYHKQFMFDWGRLRTIEAIARKNSSYKADMIIIDSESQLDTKERSQDEHHSKILKDAKRLAMEQNCMVILITRMNRDKKSSEKPSMNMLKGSSSFEYECDVIFFLYNKDKNDRRNVTCLIEKNREGPFGEVELHFKESITTFEAYNEN